MKKFFSRRRQKNKNIEKENLITYREHSLSELSSNNTLSSENRVLSADELPIKIWQQVFEHLTAEEDLIECIKVSEQWYTCIRDMLLPDTFAQQVIHPLSHQSLRHARLNHDNLRLCLTFINSSEEPFQHLEELEIDGLTFDLFRYRLDNILRQSANSLKRIVLVNPFDMSLKMLTIITTRILQHCRQLLEFAVISVDEKELRKRQWPLTPNINIVRQYPHEPRYLDPTAVYMHLASLRLYHIVDNTAADHVMDLLQKSHNLTHVILNPLTTTLGHADILKYCVRYLKYLHVLIMADGGRADTVLGSSNHCGNPPGTTNGITTTTAPSPTSSSELQSYHLHRRTLYSMHMRPQHLILIEEGRRATGNPHWTPDGIGVTHLQSSFRKIFLESLYPAKNVVWPQFFDYNTRFTSFYDLRYFAMHLGRGTTSKSSYDIDRIIYLIVSSSTMLESFTYRRDHFTLREEPSCHPRSPPQNAVARKVETESKKRKQTQEIEFQGKEKKPEYKNDDDEEESRRHNVSDRLLEVLMQTCLRLTTFRVAGSYHFSDKRLQEFIWFYGDQLTKLELDCSISIECLSFIIENATSLETFCLRHRCAFMDLDSCLTMGQGRASKMLATWGRINVQVGRITPLESSWYDIS
ncbi:hypothetical protein BDB00DRAFT_803581 [Zychaea mexicana]|uniref:uncharacterized protein n=1 Tax=Zychaea mexicana TaxID=64656 RepID=UPI0022FE9761|nr:uncharacterized protein BDB00DRAFT_803581 [Zychaea mexicana]KAI9497675.1 hypothetical protein BDB00DRAFT_803581 [Zychaea mexicana]